MADLLIVLPVVLSVVLLPCLCVLSALLCWPRAGDSTGLLGCLNRRVRRRLRPYVLDASTLQDGVSQKQRNSDVDFGALNEAAAIAGGQQVKVGEPIVSIAGEEVEIRRPLRDDRGSLVGYLDNPEHRPMAEVKLGDVWRYDHVTLVAGDLGTVVRIDARGDALIHFEWDKKDLWIDRRDLRFLLLTSELQAHCGGTCAERHDALCKCFTCGEPWTQHRDGNSNLNNKSNHRGHTCADGGRGSFLVGSLKQGQAAWALHDGAWKSGEVLKLDPLRVVLDEWRPRLPREAEPSTAQRLGFDQATCRLFGYPTTSKPLKEQPKVEPEPRSSPIDVILATEYVPTEMPRPGFLCGCGDGGARGPVRVTPASPARLQDGVVYTWAWGDPALAASLNPLRWSSYMTRQAIATELRRYDSSTNFRPVHVMDRWDGNMMFCDARVAITQLGAKIDEANQVADRHMYEIVCCFPDQKPAILQPPVGQ